MRLLWRGPESTVAGCLAAPPAAPAEAFPPGRCSGR
jgi:hypothetical protein